MSWRISLCLRVMHPGYRYRRQNQTITLLVLVERWMLDVELRRMEYVFKERRALVENAPTTDTPSPRGNKLVTDPGLPHFIGAALSALLRVFIFSIDRCASRSHGTFSDVPPCTYDTAYRRKFR